MKHGLPLLTLILVACSQEKPAAPAEPPPAEEVREAQVIYYSLGRT